MKSKVFTKIGIVLIILSIIMPLFGFLIPFLGLPVYVSAAMVGISVIGGPEVCFIVGVALAGKDSVKMVKSKFTRPAGKIRYRFGLIMFFGCFIINWVLAYLEVTNVLTIDLHHYLYVMLTFDLLTILSLLLLGPEFFAKVRILFKWEGHC